jgi:LPS-assembly protein
MNARDAQPASRTRVVRARRASLAIVALIVAVVVSPTAAQLGQIAPPSGQNPFGQLPPPPTAPPTPAGPPKPVSETTISDRREGSNDQKDWHFIGHVEMDRGGDTKIYADDVRVSTDTNHAVATGNVVFAQGNNRITAERGEFDTESKLGTFYNAWGLATVKPPKPTAARPGMMAPPPVTGNQENVVYFFGEKIEKIGPKKYKITNGGFSTCVQPTPRWDLRAGTVILNVDHYTVLTNAVMNVKGVPMLYLPVLYYPTKREDRATGFLIPTYGASTLRGQSLHNAFFWAIDRSQDATFAHDWSSKTGQGYGTEYRYNMGNGSDGNFWAHLDDRQEATYITDGISRSTPAERSYDIRGNANQQLPGNLRARANVSYFSSITSSQTFNTNIADASRNQRMFGGNLVGAWRNYTLNATLDHSEYFYDANNSTITGGWPRVQLARNERPIGDSPLYFSAAGDYSRFLRESKTSTLDPNTGAVLSTTDTDTGLSRFDVAPQLRYPFKKWQWFTVNSTVTVHETYYTRSYEPSTDPRVPPSKVVDVGLNRPLYTLQAQIVGPVFNRIWDTPDNHYAEKFKHTVEPVLTIDRTSDVDDFLRIVVSGDQIDSYVGGVRYTYGLNNRFYAKRRLTPGQPAQARDILDVEVSQSYYTNQQQSLYDRQYQTQNTLLGASITGGASNFSAIAVNVRANPTNDFNASMRAEIDPRYHVLRTISFTGAYNWAQLGQTSVTWSKNGFIPQLQGFNNPSFVSQYINGNANLHTRDNKYGTTYSINFDAANAVVTQQTIAAFYNAQCCGLAIQYQEYNYPAATGIPIPSDHRFFMSFTLAGLGNFSPFNGAMSGVPH